MSVGKTFSRDRVWRCALAAILLAASTASSIPPPPNPDPAPRGEPTEAPPDPELPFPSQGDLISDWTRPSRSGVEVRFEGSYLLQRGGYISAPEQPLLRCARVCVRARPVNHSECPADCDRDDGGRLSADGTQHVTQEFASERITLDPPDRRDFERRLGRQALQANARQFSFSDAFAKFLGEFETWARQSVRVKMEHAPSCATKRGELVQVDYTLVVDGTLVARTSGSIKPLSLDFRLTPIGSVRKFYPEAISEDEPVLNCSCRLRRDKSAPVKDDELAAIEPGLSLVTDSGFAPIAVTNATTTTVVQRLVAERLEIGARTNVAGQHRRPWRGDLARLWPYLEAGLTGSWLRAGPVAVTNVGAARRPIRMAVASLAWIPSPRPQDAELIRVSLVATGRASGEVFRLELSNPSAEALHLVAPDGLVLEPIKPGAGSPVSATARDLVQRYPVVGYCLDFAKPPPVAGMVFRIAPRAVQEQFRPLRAVLRAGRQLADAGRLHPDSNPQTYPEFVRQWAVWTQVERWDAQEFTEKFVARTKENAERSRQRWTPSMAQQLRAAAPNRWRDIRQVLDEAKTLEAGRP